MRKVEVFKAIKACLKRLLSFLNESESVEKSEKNFDGARIEKINKDFNELRDFLWQKIKAISKDLCRLEKKKKLKKKIEKNLLIRRLEGNLFKLKKYYDYDDIEYGGIRDVKKLFEF